MNSNKIRYFIALAAVGIAVAACSSKPPGCADSETLATIRSLMAKNTLKGLEKLANDDPDGWLKKFVDGLKVEVSNIVNEGYKEDAKKQLCKGDLKIVTPEGKTYEREIEYSTQRTEDKGGSFLVEIQAFLPFAVAARSDAESYYKSNRWIGNWRGTYTCGAISDAVDGPQGSFSMPVTMTVKNDNGDNKVLLERTTRGGGYEKLEGQISDESFRLAGGGENSSDDQWRTVFKGTTKGRTLSADGTISFQRSVLRNCKLELTQGAAAITVTTAVQPTLAPDVPMKKIDSAVALDGMVSRTVAKSAPSAQEITKQIIESVTTYKNAISCGGVEVEPKHIAALVPYKNRDNRMDAKYAVLWSGDIGCMGGSGTTSTNVAIVTISTNDTFVVNPNLSSPVIEFETVHARDFPKLVGNTTDSLVLDGFEYDPNGKDAMCCPSVPVRVTVLVDAKGNWKRTEKKVLQSKK